MKTYICDLIRRNRGTGAWRRLALLTAGLLLACATVNAARFDIKVSFTALAPADGLWIMRPWAGFHNGNYVSYVLGQTASDGVKHIAEDGVDTFQLANFAAAGMGTVQAMIAAQTAPTVTDTQIFTLDSNDPSSRFMSYLVMMIPSNDAFVGNADPKAFPIFDTSGKFQGPMTHYIDGTDVLDAGTEVNDELAANTAFLAQTGPGAGVHPDTNSVIHVHPGFKPAGQGGILDGTTVFNGQVIHFENADFKLPGYRIARLSIESVAVPTPTITPGQVVSGASFAGKPYGDQIAPGQLFTIFGSGLSDWNGPYTGNKLPLTTQLGSTFPTVVKIGNTVVPLLYASPTQITAQAPAELAPGSATSVTVTVGSATSAPENVQVVSASPAIFTADSSGRGLGVIVHADYSPVTANSPAKAGETVIIYTTGLGAVNPAVPTNQPGNGERTVSTVTVTVGGQSARVDFAGAAPGFIGVYQVNAVVPVVGPGLQDIQVLSGTIASPGGVTIAVSQ